MDKKCEIIKYTKKYLNQWEDIVDNSNNGTIYHQQKFLNYHPKNRFKNFHHLIALDGKICSVIPGCILNRDNKKTFISYAGSSFGGFVVPEDFGLKEMDLIITSFIEYLKKHGFKRIEITLPPVCFLRRQNNHADFILSKENFWFKKREITSVVTLNYKNGEILKTFKPACRRAVKKAINSGVDVKNDDSKEAYQTYYKILENNLSLRHNVKPVHSVNEMIDIKKRFLDEVHLYCSYYKNEMIGGIWLFKANRDASVAFYISHKHGFEKYRPVNLLYYEIIKKALSWDQRFLDLGLFTVNMKPNYGLGKFKETFAAQGMFRDYFVKEI